MSITQLQAAVVAEPVATSQAVTASVSELDSALRALVNQGRSRDALALIAKLDPATRNLFEIRYLKAQALRQTGKPREALDIYNDLLANDSTLVLIRLELAQTYTEIGEFVLAEQNFRLALAGNIAPADVPLVRAYLVQLNHANGVQGGLEFAIAPDSNINAATGLRRINIGGLWFTLNDTARHHSGVGVAAAGNVEVRGEVGGLRYVAGGYGRIREYGGSDYDDELIGFSAGPELVTQASRFSLSGVIEHRRYGGAALYTAPGLSFVAHIAEHGAVAYDAALLVQHYDYVRERQPPATLVGGEVRRTTYISARALWLLRLGLSHSASTAPISAYNAANLGVGYYSTLPHGMTIYVEPQLRFTQYDLEEPVFGIKRRDTLAAITVRMTKQDWSWHGFIPYFEVDQSVNNSNIDIQSFSRTGLRFGMRRSL